MTPEQAAALREPFAEELVGKLPRVTCGDCRDSRGKACDRHPKGRCDECGNWISSAHIHLSYVGHADVTDRLLTVDPQWTWEPMAADPTGLPMLDRAGGLWIWLTVCGVRRPGYGSADGKTGGDGMKECLGDALRNASMRFGVALDLWRREPPAVDDGGRAPRTRSAAARKPANAEPRMHSEPQLKKIMILFREAGYTDSPEDKAARLQFCSNIAGRPLDSSRALTFDEASAVIQALQEGADEPYGDGSPEGPNAV